MPPCARSEPASNAGPEYSGPGFPIPIYTARAPAAFIPPGGPASPLVPRPVRDLSWWCPWLTLLHEAHGDFLAELRRRKMIRVVVAYAIAAGVSYSGLHGNELLRELWDYAPFEALIEPKG